MTYLFLGQGHEAKERKIQEIRQRLQKGTEQFNLDILYARDLTLKTLQEKFIYFPLKSPLRIIVIKAAQELKEELRSYLLDFVSRSHKQLVLILDIEVARYKDEFVRRLAQHAELLRFQEVRKPDAFLLVRQIALKKPLPALVTLNQLLKEGQRPERILGGLRYAWERECLNPEELKRKLGLLLKCDLEIKTGRLKPAFALEKLVVSLCAGLTAFKRQKAFS